MRLTATGPADPAEVWDRYVRPSRWPEWSPQIRAVDFAADRLVAGHTGRVHGPVGLRVDFWIGTVDEDARTWTWHVRWGPVTLHLAHGVEVGAPGATTTLDVTGPLPVVLAYAPAAQWALTRLVADRPSPGIA